MSYPYRIKRDTVRPPLVTTEDLYRMTSTADGSWFELKRGVLVLCEPPYFEHADIGLQLGSHLNFYVKEKRLGKVLGDGGTYVLSRNPDTVRIPDVSFVRSARLPYGAQTQKFFEGYPDLAVEIMSPSDRFTDVERKVEEYLSAGTPLVWIIRPRDHTTIVRRIDGSTKKLTINDSLDGELVIPGFTYSLRNLFTG